MVMNLRKAWPVWATLALCWAILPALPSLLRGGFLGHGYTDLYPSVWGMWLFAEAQPGFPLYTPLLAPPPTVCVSSASRALAQSSSGSRAADDPKPGSRGLRFFSSSRCKVCAAAS